MKPEDNFTDLELVEFCENTLKEKSRPYFPKSIVRRMIALAGFPENFASCEDLDKMPQERFLMTEEMKELCVLARKNQTNFDTESFLAEKKPRRPAPENKFNDIPSGREPKLKLTLFI